MNDMSATGGYESDVSLSNFQLTGDIPLQNNVGNYAVATGLNTYTVNLMPAVTALRAGMSIYTRFSEANTAAASLAVNGEDPRAIVKFEDGGLKVLSAGDISDRMCLLVYNGTAFQLINTLLPLANKIRAGVTRFAKSNETNDGKENLAVSAQELVRYIGEKLVSAGSDKEGLVQLATVLEALAGTDGAKVITPQTLMAVFNVLLRDANFTEMGIARFGQLIEVFQGELDDVMVSPYTLQKRLEAYENYEKVYAIAPEHISDRIEYTPGRNRYAGVNRNLIVTKDIRLVCKTAELNFNGEHILNLPKPLNSPTPATAYVIESHNRTTYNNWNTFVVAIDREGRVTLDGKFHSQQEELLLTIYPYVAKYPLEYYESKPGTDEG